MAHKPSNDAILEQLKNGIAQFELVSSPVPSISTSISQVNPTALFGDNSHRFFARAGPWKLLRFSLGSSKMKKGTVEHGYDVHKVDGDGRFLFRALVKGMEANPTSLSEREETLKAEELRMIVERAICDDSGKVRLKSEANKFKAALEAIKDERESHRYCNRIEEADFFGGKPELLVLSEYFDLPIIVYELENGGSGFIRIHEYGEVSSEGSGKKPVRLLKSGSNRYDLLVSKT